MNLAARELADILGKMSGARFLVASKPVPGYRAILVGTPYRGAAKDEIRVRVRDANTLEVTGVNPRAVVYAAYVVDAADAEAFRASDEGRRCQFAPTAEERRAYRKPCAEKDEERGERSHAHQANQERNCQYPDGYCN